MRSRFLIVPLVLLALLAVPGSVAYGPYTVAGLGDSITQATNTCCGPGNHPARSWSTGDDRSDGIRSHYERLEDRRRIGSNHENYSNHSNHNNAVSGAKAADLAPQVSKAIAQKADYVTILIGANDLCAPSRTGMTSTADFAEQIGTALDRLHEELPTAGVYVSSIPDLHRLWSVLRTHPAAARAWSAGRICQSMLSAANTEAQRQEVVDRQVAFNGILAEACGKHRNCRWDGGAVYRHRFSAGQISSLDYFHPGPGGQAALAELTWQAFHEPPS